MGILDMCHTRIFVVNLRRIFSWRQSFLSVILFSGVMWSCAPAEIDLNDDWPCQTNEDCVAGFACHPTRGICLPTAEVCEDFDGDGLGNGARNNAACINTQVDSDDTDRTVCADVDGDGCEDCFKESFDPANDGVDTDRDGLCDKGDTDDDGDGVLDENDPSPLDPFICADLDNDGCDDCAVTGGAGDVGNDGLDTDGDGQCNKSDIDDDGDTIADDVDPAPLDSSVCADADNDACDDCALSNGPPDTSADGRDTNGDGICDVGDDDDDGDTVLDEDDPEPLLNTVCGDSDSDGCDDCAMSAGPPQVANDGADFDSDGLCDVGDPDADNDTVLNINDTNPLNPNLCQDADNDTCDDCSVVSGTPTINNDGPDLDNDGLCDAGDPDIDGDTVPNTVDTNTRNPNLCQDVDGDTCDDCIVVSGTPSPNNDGADLDNDGLCDAGDEDIDGDTVPNGTDIDPRNPSLCGDTDNDTCDDCSVVSGVPSPGNDGPDTDSDGICNASDDCTDTDGDTLGNGDGGNVGCSTTVTDNNTASKFSCIDVDGDGCDDCAITGGPPDVANDGPDADNDGICDVSDDCTDADGDTLGNGTLGNLGCVLSTTDSNDALSTECVDSDGDGCDDCGVTEGPPSTANDGPDADSDGICDVSDDCTDADGDTLGNGNLGNVGCTTTATDTNDALATACIDVDNDSCDDCAITQGPPAVTNDGLDTDADGQCDVSDACTDVDGDGLGDGNLGNAACINPTTDTLDSNTSVCADTDSDTCDDCSVAASFAPNNDGADLDSDGLCDAGDLDIDGDSVNNVDDVSPTNPFRCRDVDADTCDDCAVTGGPPSTTNDGSDRDSDGICDLYDWYDTAWGYRKAITINLTRVVGTHTEFPIYVTLSDLDLSAKALSNGQDLRFTAADGKTLLNFDIEQWNSATGQLDAWVNMPNLSSAQGAGPHMFLYYGNSAAGVVNSTAAVWNTDYRAVWHLNEDPSGGVVTDSTKNGHHGTAVIPVSGDLGLVDGRMGKALVFAGKNGAYLNMSNRGDDGAVNRDGINDLNPMSIELWFRPLSTGGGTYGRLLAKQSFSPLVIYPYFGTVRVLRGRATADMEVRSASGTVVLSTWHHLVVVLDTVNNIRRMYLNGSEVGYHVNTTSGSGTLTSDAANILSIGNAYSALDRGFDGIIDEVRISSVIRSADWIRTSYNNQSAPATFLSYSAEQLSP